MVQIRTEFDIEVSDVSVDKNSEDKNKDFLLNEYISIALNWLLSILCPNEAWLLAGYH